MDKKSVEEGNKVILKYDAHGLLSAIVQEADSGVIMVDCDQDCLILKENKIQGGACHTKNKSGVYRDSCFYRRIDLPEESLTNLDD